jgi:hypothetical protein
MKRERKKYHDWHHRKPSSLGKPQCCNIHDALNMSHVGILKHRSWHTLFNNMSAKAIAAEITKTWLDPDFYFVAIPRKKSRVRRVVRGRIKYLRITIEEGYADEKSI